MLKAFQGISQYLNTDESDMCHDMLYNIDNTIITLFFFVCLGSIFSSACTIHLMKMKKIQYFTVYDITTKNTQSIRFYLPWTESASYEV